MGNGGNLWEERSDRSIIGYAAGLKHETDQKKKAEFILSILEEYIDSRNSSLMRLFSLNIGREYATAFMSVVTTAL